MEQVTVQGTIDHIVYENDKNGYKVLSLETEDDEYIVVGILPFVDEGDYVEVTGEYVDHPTYGPQIKAVSCEKKVPEDEISIKRYLASGAIKGIGEKLAERIIKKFGKDTFRIMENEPERLAEVKGISSDKAREIAIAMQGKQAMRSAMMFLQDLGFSPAMSMKIYGEYGDGVYSVVKTNPYQLIEHITGIGFKTADQVAQKVGVVSDSDFRIQAGILYLLNMAGQNGHTYLPKESLVSQTMNLLQVNEDQVEKNLMDLSIERRLIIKVKELGDNVAQTQVYTSAYYHTELEVARRLLDLNRTDDYPQSVLEKKLREVEKQEDNPLCLEEHQRKAVLTAISHGLTIVTGGPGTGKTTTINQMIRFFEAQGMELSLAAPTGRAAKRMSEATGHEAKTIHRLLEVSGAVEEGGAQFAKDELNPLETDVVIIDEMSMVDIFLMRSLLKAIVPGTHLILVGDVDQLPSVGPGCVLRDIITSGCFPVEKLTKIFRQAAQSDIVLNAHKINHGETITPNPNSKDFLFVKRQAAAQIIGATVTLLRDKLPNYVKASSKDIQVLTPMKKGPLGAINLNRELQQMLNPPAKEKKEREQNGILFREGDKVMQIRNNYQREWEIRNKYDILVGEGIGVFNGDLGYVRKINTFSETVEIEFDEGKRSDYSYNQLEELELAYAVTIHKSQGSEYPAVILPLLSGPQMLMSRNLLYTAVTRAKNCVVIVGSVQTFEDMIANEYQLQRYSGLLDRIRDISMMD